MFATLKNIWRNCHTVFVVELCNNYTVFVVVKAVIHTVFVAMHTVFVAMTPFNLLIINELQAPQNLFKRV